MVRGADDQPPLHTFEIDRKVSPVYNLVKRPRHTDGPTVSYIYSFYGGRLMKGYSILLLLLVIIPVLVACGGEEGPKADLDMNARILDVYSDRQILRIGEFDAGRKYEVLVTENTPIDHEGQPLTLGDLKTTWQIRIWMNKVTGKAAKYEAVKIQVIDTGEAAPSRR